jgi:nucleoside-diphosphate-sugar epimerase
VIKAEILVTGAGGFIGGAVARFLAAQPDLAVRGATRDGRAVADGIAPCKLDVCNAGDLAAALKGVDAVVHCAVGPRQTTVEGTRLLLQAGRTAGVRRVVHFSSIAVYGEQQGAVDENAGLVSATGHGYAHWKVAAEAVCHEAAQVGSDVVILRPAIVYGPGSLQWIIRPAQRLRGGLWGGLGEAGRGTCNAVHVDDVAAACLASIHAPADAAAIQAFNVSGPETISWSGWYARLAAALGYAAPPDLAPSAWRRRVTAGLPFKALAKFVPGAGRLFENRILAAPSPSEITLFGLVATYPTGKAEAALGWQPRIGLDEGLANSVAWLRSAGFAR